MLRYIVERISDGEFLELELPIVVSGAGRKLAGAGSFSGEILPVVDVYKYAGSDALIDPLATLIHEESDGVIRGSWLITRTEFAGAVWRVEGQGFSSFFSGRPYEGEYYGVDVDPVAVARHVVEHAQSFAGANIGVSVVGSSPVRVGTASDRHLQEAEAALKAAKREREAKTLARTTQTQRKQSVSKSHDSTIKALQATSKARLEALQSLRQSNASAAQISAAQSARDAAVQAVKSAQAAKKAALVPIDRELALIRDALQVASDRVESASAKVSAAKEAVQADGGAWKLLWWDTPDCLQAVQEAVDAAGCEWVEWSGWSADRTRVLKEIRVSQRIGRRRQDLAFVEGDNAIEQVTLESDAADYANTVTAIGAGEGKQALRVTLSVASSRRRQVHVVDAKDVTKRSVLESIARAELAARSQLLSVAAVRVVDHPNAQFGSFDVGDIVLIDADGSGVGRTRMWRRIEELEWVGTDAADLMLGGA